jgi:hypothetical protein
MPLGCAAVPTKMPQVFGVLVAGTAGLLAVAFQPPAVIAAITITFPVLGTKVTLPAPPVPLTWAPLVVPPA